MKINNLKFPGKHDANFLMLKDASLNESFQIGFNVAALAFTKLLHPLSKFNQN
jgi:hypothetical protein